jgi:hypothetical protein
VLFWYVTKLALHIKQVRELVQRNEERKYEGPSLVNFWNMNFCGASLKKKIPAKGQSNKLVLFFTFTK